MDLPFGSQVYRLRADAIDDPYSLTPVRGDWGTPGVLTIPEAFVAQSSTSMLGDATREQALEAKSLFCDGSFDVQKGDRVFTGVFDPPLPDGILVVPADTALVGEIYTIEGIPPAADRNPFTGWSPPREIPLTRVVG